jgi:hypothetical protein
MAPETAPPLAQATEPAPPAFMHAPPPPSAQEWALAAQYSLKNSKRYRYNWGQQVRSLMGTAVAGPEQGVVRFRIEIAPDGRLARLDTLWTTSAAVEARARQAVQALPALPPTPTGQPLVFEKTISFQPFAADGPPIYKHDCQPDPPHFRNPFAHDPHTGRARGTAEAPPPLDAQALAECLKQLVPDTVEAESAHDQRLLDQWGAGPVKR